ncbi:MAG: Na+/H+ antiporter subunit E [Microthrixaceae bacterium]|nr:Na+/H+ antiporter subunit E [Microthrixaceae bacterium]
MKRATGIALPFMLVVLWVMLWGDLSVANVASGAAMVALVVAAIPGVGFGMDRPTVRPIWTMRFLFSVTKGLISANFVVGMEVLSPHPKVHTGVVAVPLPHCSESLLTLVANVLGLAPGTMAVEVTSEPAVIYVHVLHLRDVETVRADVTHLAELAVRAFGPTHAVEDLS